MLFIKTLAGAIASMGFAVIFNVRKENLIYAGIVGFISSLTYFVVLDYQLASPVMAVFIASFIVSIVSEIMARMIKCPTTTFLICAIIPLVPGGKLYYTMLAVINGTIDEAIYLLIGTIADAGAIVIASAIVGGFVKIFDRLSYK